jgi:hypothetical protein
MTAQPLFVPPSRYTRPVRFLAALAFAGLWFAGASSPAQLVNITAPCNATSYNSFSGIANGTSIENMPYVKNITNGCSTEYNAVNLNGVTSFQARVASAGLGGTINIYIDALTGTEIGSVAVPVTGGWQTWTNVSCALTGASGVHDVYLEYTGGTGASLFNVEWFQFQNQTPYGITEAAAYNTVSAGIGLQACSEGGQNIDFLSNGSSTSYNAINLTNLASFSARVASAGTGGSIQICLDSPTGAVVGTCSVSPTGGWQNWTTVSCSISPTTGFHTIYLVYTGSTSLFNVEWFAFKNSAILQTSGLNLVDGNGLHVQLRGVNLGSWLIMEPWMCPADSSGLPDEYSIISKLDSRFGVATEQSLIQTYRQSWMTTQDLDNIQAQGLNLVRVPVWYGDFYTLAGAWRSDAFTLLDWLVSNAYARGIYTIIDMHGVFGGQSTSADTGRQNLNQYWTSSTDQTQTAQMWANIAAHYNGNPGIAGYDLLNEPSGAPNNQAVWNAYQSLYNTIRAVDAAHIIIMEGTFNSWNWSMLPNPTTYGWTNVMYEMHDYDWTGTLSAVEGGADGQVSDFNNHKSWNVPDYIGEFNALGSGGAGWRYELNDDNGDNINWSMWSYKSSNGSGSNSWGVYNVKSSAPRTPNITSDSSSTISSNWSQWTTANAFAINPTSGPIITGFSLYTANNLAVAGITSGFTEEILSDSNFYDGEGVELASTAVGDFITFTVPNVSAQTYEVHVRVKLYNNRGISQLGIGPANGNSFTNVGSPLDQYSPAAQFQEFNLGTWTPGTTSDKWFQFTITGQNANSSNFSEVFDYIRLVPQ